MVKFIYRFVRLTPLDLLIYMKTMEVRLMFHDLQAFPYPTPQAIKASSEPEDSGLGLLT